MADLPDIDTSQVSFLTYWNAIDDGGVGTIDPEQVTSASGILDYTLYDNGLEGTFDMPVVMSVGGGDGPPTATFRVKSDGWMVVYLDRYENFNTRVSTTSYSTSTGGWWDIDLHYYRASEGSDEGSSGSPNIQDNTLFRIINHLRQEFSNAGSMTFNMGDIGLFNYEYSSATATTVLATGEDSSSSSTPGFSYTSGTTLHRAISTGYVDGKKTVSFEGVTIASDKEIGSLDLQAQGLIPNSGTEYNHSITSHDYGGSVGALYAMWE